MILFMGVAGSGKSIQGRQLADEKGYAWLSTGEFLRMLVSGQRRIEMISGKLLEDSEMIQLVDKVLRLIDVKEEFILDGFPRTKKQATWLLAQAEAGLLNLTHIIHLNASEPAVRKRLLKRGRVDDTEEVIKRRFKEYHEVTMPILAEFKKHGFRVHEINAEKSMKAVQREICKKTGL